MSTKVSLKSVTASKKIESPLAKYNSVGQLFCVLCNTQVKNEMYWTGHINGKAHRDQMVLLKNKGKAPSTSNTTAVALKRPASASSSKPSMIPSPSTNKQNGISSSASSTTSSNSSTFLAKRLKFQETELSPMGPPPLVSILKKAKTGKTPPKPPPRKSFEQIEAEEALMEIERTFNVSNLMEQDEEEEEVAEEEEPEEEEVETTETLPAGFFDDAKEDAKARGLEYKNPDEAEWDRFVKEIATEEVKSVALRTADDEDSAKDRELDEIEEQMKNWQRVLDLEKKAEAARKQVLQDKGKKDERMNESDDEDADEEYVEDLDWRTKKY